MNLWADEWGNPEDEKYEDSLDDSPYELTWELVSTLELNAKLAERERIVNILATMRDTTHEDAWDTLDDAIDAINGVSQDYDIDPVSENHDKEN